VSPGDLIKARVYLNLSEILGSLKRDWVYLSPNITKNHQTVYKTAQNMRGQQRDS